MLNRLVSIILLVFLMLGISCCPPVLGVGNNQIVDVYQWAVKPNEISVYFTATAQDPSPVLVGLIDSASKKIDVAMYELSDSNVVKALSRASMRGIKVRLIVDSHEAMTQNMLDSLESLANSHVLIRENKHTGKMNLKLVIIDNSIVTTGSWDCSLAASETWDNDFVVCSQQELVKAYSTEFERMWGSEQFVDLGSQ